MGLVQAKIETEIETSPQLIESLHMARQVAVKTDVAQVLPEHLQLAMLEDDESSFLLEAYGVDFKKVRVVLAKQAKKASQPGIQGQQAVFSPQIEAIIQHARDQAQKNALGEVDSNLVLAVMLSEKGGFLQKQLTPYDLDCSGVLQYLELREGKTVTIDPLPPLKNIPILVAPKTAPPLARKQPAPTLAPTPPALAPTPTAPPRAPVVQAPAVANPPSGTAASASPTEKAAQSAHAPVAPSPVEKPPLSTPPIAPPEMAQAQQTPFEQKAPSSQPLPPPRAQHPPNQHPPQMTESVQTNSGAPAHEQAPLSSKDLTRPAAYGKSRATVPPPFAPPPDSATVYPTKDPLPEAHPSVPPAAPTPAPPKKRSLFGGFRRKNKAQAPQAEYAASDASAQNKQNDSLVPASGLSPAPATDPAGSALQAANHNHPEQSLPTNLLSPQDPPVPSVDTLLNQPPVSGQPPVPNQPPVPGQPQTLEALHAAAHLRNRPAKRRRANPDSLGANESLSATGSVLEKGRLVENIPRRMKVNLPCRAQVRITRAHMDEINSEFADLSSSHIHELAVTEAMTVQLRAPGGGFHIENLSPQTQWIDRNQRHIDDADFGAWKWNVTPTKSGKSRLQLVISARTVDDEGNIHIADIPDKIIELAIARDHRTIAKSAAIVSVVGLAGLLVGKYGESVWHWVSQLTNMAG